MKKSDVAALTEEAYSILDDLECDIAIERAIMVLKNAPRAAESFLLLAEVSQEKDKFDHALMWINRGLDIHPGHEALLLKKAEIFLDGFEDVDEAYLALTDLEKEFGRHSVHHLNKSFDQELLRDTYLLLTDCYRLKGNLAQAFVMAERCKAVSPSDESALLALATAHFELGDFHKALSLIVPIDQRHEQSDFFWLKGQILCAQGNIDAADEAFGHAKRLDKNKYHRPLRLSQGEFRTNFDLAVSTLPREIREFLTTIPTAFFEVVEPDRIKKSAGKLSPLVCMEWAELDHDKKLLVYQRNIENLSLRKEEIKHVVASAILHELRHAIGHTNHPIPSAE